MLILTRRTREAVMLGDHITVRVLGIKGNQVRLAFDAPKELQVYRKEVFERIKQQERDHKAALIDHKDRRRSEREALQDDPPLSGTLRLPVVDAKR